MARKTLCINFGSDIKLGNIKAKSGTQILKTQAGIECFCFSFLPSLFLFFCLSTPSELPVRKEQSGLI